MKIHKPYKRIIRPFSLPDEYIYSHGSREMYLLDEEYAIDRYEIIRAYHILEKDLITLFEYIEPSDSNLNTYSYRIYELFLRASTEFELNAKKILTANEYSKKSNFNIIDYYKINAANKLDEYQIFINIWAGGKKKIQPFSEWSKGHQLTWYQDYNSVKHNRYEEFSKASLQNLLSETAAVFSIIFSQFHMFTFTQYQTTMSYQSSDEFELSSKNTMFSIILPQSWQESEMYDFNWTMLKKTTSPFQNYVF